MSYAVDIWILPKLVVVIEEEQEIAGIAIANFFSIRKPASLEKQLS